MDLSKLQQQLGLTAAQSHPPIEQWQPKLCGDIDIEIRADGSWWHEGTAFERQDLVRLFASILRCEQGEYFLVTPVEKWRIRVVDKPFVITLIDEGDCGIEFVSNVGDVGLIGADHPLRLSQCPAAAEPVPEVKVRHDLWARLSRNVYYALAEHAFEQNQQWCIESDGAVFVIGNV